MHKFIAYFFLSLNFLNLCAQSKQVAQWHEVAKGETLYAISKKYHVSVESIQKLNNFGNDTRLKTGQKIRLPGAAAHASETNTTAPHTAVHAVPEIVAPAPDESKNTKTAETATAKTHVVVKGETAYGIAKANGLSVKQLKEANHLADDLKLKLGQKLLIPSKNQEAMYKPAAAATISTATSRTTDPAPSKPEPGREYLNNAYQPVQREKEPVQRAPKQIEKREEPAAAAAAPPAAKPAESPAAEPTKTSRAVENNQVKTESDRLPIEDKRQSIAPLNENINPEEYEKVYNGYEKSGLKKRMYRGISAFMQTENPGNQFLALYNYADMGTILKVTNLLSKQSIYVKVIGKVPLADAQKDIILKVSSDAADRLKTSEDKFLVEVTGYMGE